MERKIFEAKKITAMLAGNLLVLFSLLLKFPSLVKFAIFVMLLSVREICYNSTASLNDEITLPGVFYNCFY